MTTNHSKPETSPEPTSHITAYASVVQGRMKNPSRGRNQPSKDRLSRSLKSQMKNSASRGEMSESSAMKQPIG